jgi:hypothetical protein
MPTRIDILSIPDVWFRTNVMITLNTVSFLLMYVMVKEATIILAFPILLEA